MTSRPIEIIGGGLAGLSLGLALRREEIPVTIHEAGDYPRHRVCGEFIAGLGESTVERLGLRSMLADALRHTEVAWSIRGEPPHLQRLPAPALGIGRDVLDHRLAEAYTRAGGRLVTHSRVSGAADLPGRVIASGRRRATNPQWLGLKLHVRDLPVTRDLEMHLGERCYVGLSKVDQYVVNICGLFARRPIRGRGIPLFLEYLRAAGLEGLALRLSRAEPDPDSFCAVAGPGFDRRFNGRAGMFLGDAAATIPPFTGNGMAMAFQGAEVALPALLRYARGECDWREACRVTRAALRRRFWLRLTSAGALHPFLLQPRRQRWFAALGRAQLLPFTPLYTALH